MLALSGCVGYTPTPAGGESTKGAAGSAGVFTTNAFSIGYPRAGARPPARAPTSQWGTTGIWEPRARLSLPGQAGASCTVLFKEAVDAASARSGH